MIAENVLYEKLIYLYQIISNYFEFNSSCVIIPHHHPTNTDVDKYDIKRDLLHGQSRHFMLVVLCSTNWLKKLYIIDVHSLDDKAYITILSRDILFQWNSKCYFSQQWDAIPRECCYFIEM
jgi:hypothetical protein